MKVINKFIFSVFLISLVIMLYSMNNIQANAWEFEGQAKAFISKGKSNANIDTSTITNQFKDVGQFLSYVGAGIMVAVTSYLGVQYIMSPPDKQAALKEKLIGVVVSGIVIFGAYEIWSIVVNIVKDF